MAFSEAAVAVLFLLALANGQNSPSCSDPRVQAGSGLMANPERCDMYYACNAALERTLRSCGPGTLFHSELFVCTSPQECKCAGSTCDSTTAGRRTAHACCDKYIECTGAGYIIQNCTNGQVFNPQSGQCQSGLNCVNLAECRPLGTVPVANQDVCHDFPHANGNPCQFRTQLTPEIYVEDRPCPYGTSFNATACQCTIRNNACAGNSNITQVKALDSQCRYSFRCEFDNLNSQTGAPVALTDKIGSGNVPLPDMIQTVGTTVTSGIARLQTNPITRALAYMYCYSFNKRQLTSPVTIQATFRFNSAQQSTFQILSNSHPGGACIATLEATANYNGQSLTVNTLVTAVTQTGINTQIVNSANVTATINVQPGNWCEYRMYFNKQAWVELTNRGNDGVFSGQTVNSTVTGTIGEFLAYNDCGFMFGYGSNCDFEKIGVREGCLDLSRARQ